MIARRIWRSHRYLRPFSSSSVGTPLFPIPEYHSQSSASPASRPFLIHSLTVSLLRRTKFLILSSSVKEFPKHSSVKIFKGKKVFRETDLVENVLDFWLLFVQKMKQVGSHYWQWCGGSRSWYSNEAMGIDSNSGLIEVPLAQTGEGIAECELLKWFVKEVCLFSFLISSSLFFHSSLQPFAVCRAILWKSFRHCVKSRAIKQQ